MDAERLGLTGISGGGTMTTLITANEPRLTMSAPGCYITTWRRETENELPADAEQMPPRILGMGMEMYDMLVPHIPKSLILLTQESDFFDQRGALEARDRLAHIYRLLGVEDEPGYYVGAGGHACTKPMREAMVAHFAAASGMDIDPTEPELVAETEETLQCSATGQIYADPGDPPASCFDFTAARSRELAALRGEPSSDELRRRVRELLALPERDGPPEFRILRTWTDRSYARPCASHFVLDTDMEFGAQAVVTMLTDERLVARPLTAEMIGGDGSATLYVPERSSDAELREDERIRAIETESEVFFACDYRGGGESLPDTCNPGSYDNIYGSDYFYAANAEMLGESYVAWRVHDVLSALDWMGAFGYDRVHLVARGRGAIVAALAGVLHEGVVRVTLIGAPTSFAEMAETRYQQWPESAMLPGVLASFDLPDLYRELGGKGLELIEPRNALME